MNLRMIGALGLTTAMFVSTALAFQPWAWNRPQAPRKESPAISRALEVIADWPDDSRDLAGAIIDEYGAPDKTSSSRLVWTARPPWKNMTVFRRASDGGRAALLLRTVAYVVPVQRWRALEAFGHGVEYDPLKGELSARSTGEAANFLALNLADEVVRGHLSAADASALYDKTLSLMLSGKSSSYTARLRFRPN